MLWKLSLTGIKSRFRDYAVLFSGLTLAAAIFYMFMTIAINPAFIKGALVVAFSITKYVFGFGIVLLSLITLVYIVYANSFLLSMRQKDYGMYMMLGARNSKIGRLIFTETLVVGLLATLLGTVIGIGLTQVVSKMLISQLGLQIHKFVGFYLPAIAWTIIFFMVLFFLAALWNRHKLVKANIVDLLHEAQKPVKLQHNPVWKTIEAVLGIALLAVGYWAMWDYKDLMTNSIIIAFFTIVIGSYFVFDSLFTGIINLLQKNQNYKYRGLHAFTLGQLKFRLGDYNRILSVVSLLFALALGAITVGLNFNSVTDQTLESSYYDVTLFSQSSQVKKQLKKVSVQSTTKFNYKYVENKNKKDALPVIYVVSSQIKKANLKFQDYYQKNGQPAYRTTKIDADKLNKVSNKPTLATEMNSQLAQLTPFIDSRVKAVSQKQYDQVKAPDRQVELLTVADFKQNFANIEKLQNLATTEMFKAAGESKSAMDVSLNNSKTGIYRTVSGVASGFEFMGFFLGIAFLAMLASTLMFKVLSGANSDKPRYRMLWKIGAKQKLLRASIAKEIGVLFALPAVLGIVDVLFGLQFFKSMLKNPYDKIWIPFTIFLILYLIYYLITVKLYEGIVLKKN